MAKKYIKITKDGKGNNVFKVVINGVSKWTYNENRYGDYALKLAETSLEKEKKVTNIIIDCKTYAKLLIISKTYGVQEIKIDKEDVERVSERNWFVTTSQGKISGIGSNVPNESVFLLSRFLMNLPRLKDDKRVVDVIDRDYTNMQKSNLRVTNRVLDGLNRNLNKNSNTGITGIYFNENKKCYSAYIQFNGKNYRKCFSFANMRTREEALILAIQWRINKKDELLNTK